jgi:hypothetical protein
MFAGGVDECTTGDDSDWKYLCTHDLGAYRNGFKCDQATQQGEAPVCFNNQNRRACCCDPDGDCKDGTDDWCCAGSLPPQHQQGQCLESTLRPHFCTTDDVGREHGRLQCAPTTTNKPLRIICSTGVPACCCDIDGECMSDGTDDWCCPEAGHCVEGHACKFVCTHNKATPAFPDTEGGPGGGGREGGTGATPMHNKNKRKQCTLPFQGEPPLCSSGQPALCCDPDGSCLDGDDAWCCAGPASSHDHSTIAVDGTVYQAAKTKPKTKVRTLVLSYVASGMGGRVSVHPNNTLVSA